MLIMITAVAQKRAGRADGVYAACCVLNAILPKEPSAATRCACVLLPTLSNVRQYPYKINADNSDYEDRSTMLSQTDRVQLERVISNDPFAAAMPTFIEALRTDDLMAVLWLHQREGGNCACGRVPLGGMHTAHVAEMIRRAVTVTPC